MFADKPSGAALHDIRPAQAAARKRIFGGDFKVPEARCAWLRF